MINTTNLSVEACQLHSYSNFDGIRERISDVARLLVAT